MKNTPMNIIYRKLQSQDTARYRQARLDSLKNFPDAYGSLHAEEAAMPKLKFEPILEQDSDEGFIVGAFCGDELVGIVGFLRDRRHKTRHRGDIVQVYVDPAYRGQGIGEQLLREVVDIAFRMDGIEQLHLGVVSENLSAIRLYEKMGFEAYGIYRNHFRDGSRYWHQQYMQLFKDRYVAQRDSTEALREHA